MKIKYNLPSPTFLSTCNEAIDKINVDNNNQPRFIRFLSEIKQGKYNQIITSLLEGMRFIKFEPFEDEECQAFWNDILTPDITETSSEETEEGILEIKTTKWHPIDQVISLGQTAQIIKRNIAEELKSSESVQTKEDVIQYLEGGMFNDNK